MSKRGSARGLHRSIDNAVAGFLIVVGAIGVLVEIAHLFGFDQFVVHDPDHGVLLAVIGFIAVGLGFERLLRFRSIEESIEGLSSMFAQSVGGRLLKGRDENYAATIVPIAQANRRIRSLVSLDPTKAPTSFSEAVARRLRESKDAGDPIQFEVIFACRESDLPPDFASRIAERLQVYEKAGVADLVSRFVLETNPHVTFDVLIIDEAWACISFPVVGPSVALQTGIVFEEKPSVATELAQWFDQRVIRSAVPYETWCSRR